MKLAPLVLLVPVLALAARAAESPAPSPQVWESTPFSLLPRAFQSDPRLDLSVITEMTAEGRKLSPPSAASPSYYVAIDSGEREEGDVSAGEKRPSAQLLLTAMQSALRVNSYLPADAAHPPSLLISYVWGSFNELKFTGTGDDLELKNLAARAAIVGGLRFAGEMMKARVLGGPAYSSFRHRDAHTEWLVERSTGNLYFVMVTAFDYASAAKGEKKILWRTKMSTDSNGLTMDESVPTLMNNSGMFLGRETAEPARLNRPILKDGSVHVGDPTVKGYDEPPSTPGSRAATDHR